MWFLGVDIGTTHIKVVGIAEDGTVLEPLRVRTPVTVAHGLAFHNGDDCWAAVAELTARYADGPAAGHGALAAVAVATFGQEEAFPVDADGVPLFDSLAWWECWPERSLAPSVADELDSFEHYRVSGMRFRDNQSPDRIAHIQRNHPELWTRVQGWVDVGTYVSWKLSGEWVAASSQITHSQFFDLTDLRPHERSLQLLGLSPSLFPRVARPGDRIGGIRPGALPGVDIAQDAAVYVGGHDQVIAAYANDRHGGPAVIDSIGTAEYVMMRSRNLEISEPLYHLGADVEHGWEAGELILGWGLPTGKVLQLLADLFFAGDYEALLDVVAAESAPSTISFRVNDLRDPDAGLITIGRIPAGVSAAEVVGSAVGQLSAEIRDAVSLMARLAGTSIDSVALTGSLFQRPQLVSHRERLWPWPLAVSNLAEAVATGAAELARNSHVAAGRKKSDAEVSR